LQHLRRLNHRVGSVRDYDAVFGRVPALAADNLPVGFSHVETVNHHQSSYFDVEIAASQFQHLRNMGILKKQSAVDFVVLLVKRAARDQDAYRLIHVAIFTRQLN
jgi:hypothetical protein